MNFGDQSWREPSNPGIFLAGPRGGNSRGSVHPFTTSLQFVRLIKSSAPHGSSVPNKSHEIIKDRDYWSKEFYFCSIRDFFRRRFENQQGVVRMRESKFVVLGAGGVGKTSLVVRFLDNIFNNTYKPTVEDCYQHNIQLPGENINIFYFMFFLC